MLWLDGAGAQSIGCICAASVNRTTLGNTKLVDALVFVGAVKKLSSVMSIGTFISGIPDHGLPGTLTLPHNAFLCLRLHPRTRRNGIGLEKEMQYCSIKGAVGESRMEMVRFPS
jgi:hypothetical protein